ncbi:toll-like receptor 3 [Patella vulgata]|uniref:toll-like receptor 3 n=1 Tax=Patella vulgata TaxID=6465 RepID=UPI00217F2364|nr:toll-like receptor 3 [Patella vulgata]
MKILVLISLLIVQSKAKLCPSRCFCSKDLSTVNCSGKKMTNFPSNIPLAVKKLILDHNLITEIPVGPLKNLFSLSLLDLRNNKINTIEPGAFLDCGQLQQLYLVTNKFTSVKKGAFNGANSLFYLSMSANRLSVIPPLGPLKNLASLVLEGNQISDATFPTEFLQLKKLRDVILSNNPIGNLLNTTFSNLRNSSVQKLEIARSQISKVDPATFSYLTQIKSLKIGYNPLNKWQLKNIMAGLRNSPIISIDIRNISLGGSLPAETFSWMEKINDLSLRNNRIQSIQQMAFVNLPKLLQIDLTACNIMSIDPEAFYNLSSIQRIFLTDNKLTSVPKGLPPSLQMLHLEKNQLTAIKNDDFANSTSLLELYLGTNKIHVLQENSFAGLNRLNRLHLQENRIANLPGSLFGNLGRLISLSLNKNNLKTIQDHSSTFDPLVSLTYLGLVDNQCSYLPLPLFNQLTSLVFLELSNNNLGSLISADSNGQLFAGLSKLERLDLDGNQISTVHDSMLRELVSLKNLSLARNEISHWGEHLFTKTQQLRGLNLSYNLITLINQTSLKDLNYLKVFDLRKSPFDCSCDLRWFRNWINHTQVILPDLPNWTCAAPTSWQGKSLLSFKASKIDCRNWTLYYILSGAGVGLVLSTLIMMILYRYRWFVSFRLYRAWKFVKGTTNTDFRGYEAIPGEDKHYDVYISCAPEDNVWVIEKLLPRIDNGKINEREFQGNFNVCFSVRDFEPHLSVVSCINRHLTSSRRAFIILSKHYCQDRRCEFELHNIMAAVSEGDIEDYTVIVVGKLPIKYVPKLLRKTIEKHHYIEYPNANTVEDEFIEKVGDILESRNNARGNVIN